MALLEIETPQKKVLRRAVGIDLGTTHSLVGFDINGEVQVLADEQNQVLLPSCVRYLPTGECIVGQQAKVMFSTDPKNTIVSVKRLMGRTPQEALKVMALPYEFVDVDAPVAQIQTCQGCKNPIQISAQILKKLMSRVHAQDASITDAVITVPAYFDDAQRQATKDAALLAGIHVLRLINEPTAAAIAYGLDSQATGHCLVYDLGGGTFDVSILQLSQGVFETLATGGDTALGGDDIDHVLAQWLMKLSEQTLTLAQALVQGRAIKEQLSEQQSIEFKVLEQTYTLTSAQLNDMIAPIIDKTLAHCARVMRDAKLDNAQLDQVVLVGGSTRIPYLRERVTQFFNQAPLTHLNPDTVVAQGAAIQASLISGHRRSDLLLLDVIPLSLGVEMVGGVVDKVLMRNTPIPAQASTTFTTFKDNQTGLVFHVVQGEREQAEYCRSLARFELTGITPMPAGKARIEVHFQVDADGLLSVRAKEQISGVTSHVEVKPTYGLSPQEITTMVKDAIQHADDDLKARKALEQQVETESLLLLNQRIEASLVGKIIDEVEA